MPVDPGAELDPAITYHLVNSLGWTSLRPMQSSAVEPVRTGRDCLLIAPTAGGKTEAALLPLLSTMAQENWHGLTVLYVAPLRALLNNLHPRLEEYGQWIGRRVGLWHGDVGSPARRAMLTEPPDILLTTPESIEALLVSTQVDERSLFSQVRTVVVDELHSFAASDRGWHLLGVLERVERLAQRQVQRVGLSATLGNPEEIARWLQGSSEGREEPVIVTEQAPPGARPPEITLDYVGTVANAAKVISLLHRGEKRLVFLESRRLAEKLTYELRELQVETFVSHSSLAADERRRSERAFAEARDCVIVATSTLELGVDIGDLDRVIQIDSPKTVASFLQRLGRTGRRRGTVRNMTFLATSGPELVKAAGILLLWQRGFVEPVHAPPHPRHLAAQQLLALALQEGAVGASGWREWWGDLALMDDGEQVLEFLRANGFLVEDGGLLMIGPAAEASFGRRHFMDLLTSFEVEKELRVVAGTREIGFVSPLSISGTPDRGAGAKPLVLNGYGWRVLDVDWKRFVVDVHPEPVRGDVRWSGGEIVLSFEVLRAQRDVLLGAQPSVQISRRAIAALADSRGEAAPTVDDGGLVLQERGLSKRLWTWAGLKANRTFAAVMGYGDVTATNEYVDLPVDAVVEEIRHMSVIDAVPAVSDELVDVLKFSAALPRELAVRTLAERFTDRVGAEVVLSEAWVGMVE